MKLIAFAIAVVLVLVLAEVHANYDYGEALLKSLVFYQAQRSGRLYGMHELASWRKDSALNDRGQNGEDLTGGYYDAGDFVKFGYPMAYTVTVLAWSAIDYEEGYNRINWLDEARNAVRWGTDYFLKAHVSKNELYVQVGDVTADHAYWGRPEDMTMARPALKIDAAHPGSDAAAETAAALAAASIVFRRAGDAAYADLLLQHAKDLFSFADTYRGKYSDSIGTENYVSNDYTDELVWGAIWLYRASNDGQYLAKAEKYYTDYGIQYRNGFGWMEKSLGATALLLKLTNGDLYRNVLENFCNNLVYNQKRTPKGLVYIGLWGSLRQAFDPTFICMKAADEGINPDTYRNFAKSQIDYALGSTGRSFVVGFGNNPPTHEHHRAASCPDAPAPCNYGVTYWGTQPNYHVLYGALVGGPDENDGYTDDRNNFEQNEVACDYNAAYQGVLAGLKALGY
ncbi:hypothetical protein R5R35_010198 [Gryllus longicercus]|uniref:Endoglucanase n=1 Tax=Gryllus longicercus TaxID=2509291 RepID=A0AAN9VU38_9ORTH